MRRRRGKRRWLPQLDRRSPQHPRFWCARAEARAPSGSQREAWRLGRPTAASRDRHSVRPCDFIHVAAASSVKACLSSPDADTRRILEIGTTPVTVREFCRHARDCPVAGSRAAHRNRLRAEPDHHQLRQAWRIAAFPGFGGARRHAGAQAGVAMGTKLTSRLSSTSQSKGGGAANPMASGSSSAGLARIQPTAGAATKGTGGERGIRTPE